MSTNYIVGIRLDNEQRNLRCITHFRYRTGLSAGALDVKTCAEMVEFIRDGGTALVERGDGDSGAPVEVVERSGAPAYLRTVATGTATDSLLSLPEFF